MVYFNQIVALALKKGGTKFALHVCEKIDGWDQGKAIVMSGVLAETAKTAEDYLLLLDNGYSFPPERLVVSDSAVFEELKKRFSAPEVSVNSKALIVRILGHSGKIKVISEVYDRESSAEILVACVEAISNIGGEPAEKFILNAFNKMIGDGAPKKDKGSSKVGINNIAKRLDPKVIEVLLDGAMHVNLDLCHVLIERLSTIGNEALVEIGVKKSLSVPVNPRLLNLYVRGLSLGGNERRKATELISSVGLPAVRHLLGVFVGLAPDLKAHVVTLLARITSENFGYNLDTWVAWADKKKL